MLSMGTTGQEVEEEEYSKRDQAVIQLAKLLTTMTGRHPPPGECATLVDLLTDCMTVASPPLFIVEPGMIGADQFEQSSSDEIIVEQPKEVGHEGGADREQLQVSRTKGRAAGKVSGNQGEGEGTGIPD